MTTWMRRVITSPGLYWAALLQLAAFLYAAIGVLPTVGLSYYGMGDVAYFLVLPRGDVIHLVLPLIGALPAAGLCAQDQACGRMPLVLYRCGLKDYVLRRMGQAVLGAVLAVGLGLFAYDVMINLQSPYTLDDKNLAFYRSYQWHITTWRALPLALDMAYRLAFAAATWALVGLGFAAFLPQAQALLATFIAYYFLSQLLVGSPMNDWMPQRIQLPDIFTGDPLWHYSLRQLVQFLLGAAFGGLGVTVALRRSGALQP